jgi:hypothetical protein
MTWVVGRGFRGGDSIQAIQDFRQFGRCDRVEIDMIGERVLERVDQSRTPKIRFETGPRISKLLDE